MSNPLSEVREAIWQLLDSDAGVTAFIDAGEGTRYRFAESGNLPVKLGADDCPALVVFGRRAEIDWETTSSQGIEYRVEIRGYTAGTEAERIEEFAYLVYTALAGGLPDFGVAAVEGIEFAGPSFGTYRSGGARFSEFALGAVARIHSDVST